MKTTRTRKPAADDSHQEGKSQDDGRPQPGSRIAAILNAAERVFGTHGYAGASMRKISESGVKAIVSTSSTVAGVSPANSASSSCPRC
ncbi:MAG: TetR family transcriptional regulator [Cupriavidus sp.]|nr:MAG: TetR family transcriptional regulator [Cupriavidus sp.]